MFNNQIIAGSSGQGGSFYDYTIDQSLRLQNGVTQNLTVSSAFPTATDRKKVTVSFWYKKLLGSPNAEHAYYHSGSGLIIQFATNETMYLYDFGAASGGWQIGSPTTDRLFRDPSAWYHVALILDSTQATDSDRAKLYINGELWSLSTWTVGGGASRYPSLNATFNAHTGTSAKVLTTGTSGLHGYVAEFMSIDGQDVSINDLGETVNGVWVAKEYTGSFGNAGFHLDFADSSAIGNDVSGNNVDFTADAGFAAHDVMLDSPTNNFPTLNSLDQNTGTLSEGNLKVATVSTSSTPNTRATFAVNSGKWYWEYRTLDTQPHHFIGIVKSNKYGSIADDYITASAGGNIYADGSVVQSGLTTWTNNGDVLGIALDADAETVQYYLNGSSHGTAVSYASFMSGEYVAPWFIDGASSIICTGIANFGQDSTFAGNTTAGGNADGNGYGDFKYAPPSGFLALCSANLDEPAIGPNSTTTSDQNFNTVLWTGDGSSSNAITGVGFQPDFVWLKQRSSTQTHQLLDVVRGKIGAAASFARLRTDTTAVEATPGSDSGLLSLDSDGFTLGTDAAYNASSATYVGWNWKAGGTAVSNTDGSITSQVSANQDAGFSIVTYTGTGSNATVGHGLSQTPEWVVTKSRDTANSWYVYVPGNMSSDKVLAYNATNAEFGSVGAFIESDFNATTFGVGTETPTNKSGDDFVAHCFHSVPGYSAVGSYVGNGSTDGPFIYLGFRPAWWLMKSISDATHWVIYDSARETFNDVQNQLLPNEINAEAASGRPVDFLSNGVKIRFSSYLNDSGQTYIYLAFAEAPFKYSNAR